MSKTFRVILFIIPVVVKCVNVDTYQGTKENNLSFEHRGEVSKFRACVTIQIVDLKPFMCNYEILWQRLDHLKQWKRRRRDYMFAPIIWYKTDRLRSKRRAVDVNEKVGPYDVFLGLSTVGVEAAVAEELELIERFKERWPVDLWRQYGLFTDDYLRMINQHWLRFPPPAPFAQYALGSLYILMMIVGCTGNALVLVMYFRSVFIKLLFYFSKKRKYLC